MLLRIATTIWRYSSGSDKAGFLLVVVLPCFLMFNFFYLNADQPKSGLFIVGAFLCVPMMVLAATGYSLAVYREARKRRQKHLASGKIKP